MSLKQIEADRLETLARAAKMMIEGTITEDNYNLRCIAINAAHDQMKKALLENRSYNRREKEKKAKAVKV